MQRFGIMVDEVLAKGLRAEKTTPRQTPSLCELLNLRVGRAGLEEKRKINQPISTEVSWPFPQLYFLEREWLLCHKDGVYVIDSMDFSKSKVINANSALSWHVADFHYFIVLTNGNKVYSRSPETGLFSEDSELPKFKTCCNFRGQIFAGNFSGYHDADETFVGWSNIGSKSFEIDRKNEAGYMPADAGEIFKVLPHPRGIIAYGSEGVTAFQPTSGQPYFSKIKLANFGVASRDAAANISGNHVFMDDGGKLWAINSSFEIKELGYAEFFKEFLGSDIVITTDYQNQDFYISDGNRCFLLASGLSEISELPTGLEFYNGTLYGVFSENDKSGFELCLSAIDFGWGGIKRLESVELGINCDVNIYGCTDWRSNIKSGWRQTDWVRFNDVGSGVVRARAKEFRPRLKSESAEIFNLDWIRLWYKVDDQRFIRGNSDDS